MELAIGLVLCVLFFIFGLVQGWQLHKRYLNRLTAQVMQMIHEEEKEETSDLTHIVIEKHNDMLYVYDRETMTFMAQADNKENLEKTLQERFPGKRFACSEKTLLELGFLS